MAKIAIIGSKGIPARYGGFETLAENLVKQLEKSHSFIVYCSGLAYDVQPETYLGAELEYIPLDANGWQSIPYDIWSMIDASRKADVLLVLGVSGCLFLPVLKLFSRKTVLVNLDGLDWNRPKWGRLARTFLKLSESIAARFADGLVADNAAIQDYITEEYGRSSYLVAYGGDNALAPTTVAVDESPSVVALHKPDKVSTLIAGFDRYAIAVCRIEPENNIDVILDAFATTDALPLVFIGNWEANAYAEEMRRRYGDHKNILLLDPIYDQGKLFALRSKASLYLHGHSAGGTNPSLVESMCLGLPVAACDVVFNRATTHEEALYFHDVNSLREILNNTSLEDLAANGERMHELGRTHYSWELIAEKYSDLFYKTGGGKEFVDRRRPDQTARMRALKEKDGKVSKINRAG